MDAHSTPLQTAHDGARFLSPLRIVALGLIAAAAGLAVWQLREDSREGSVPLLADTLLPSSELALMEAAFDRAKLTDYAIDGGRILVPKGRQSSYMRALVDAEALPREFGGSLRRAMETSSPWQSRAEQLNQWKRCQPSVNRYQPYRRPHPNRSVAPLTCYPVTLHNPCSPPVRLWPTTGNWSAVTRVGSCVAVAQAH